MQQHPVNNQEYLWGHTPHQHSLTAVESRLEHLEHRLDKLTLINRALWEIQKKEHNLSMDDLLAKMAEIDLRDGHLDHQMRNEAVSCPSCGRKTSRQRSRCIYCAAEMPADVFPNA